MNHDSSTTLTMHWDAGLIVVSYLTSVQASYTALQILQMRTNIWLLAVAALCLAVCGVWSMHFIGMAAMSVATDVTYDLGWTIASVFFAFFPTFAAFWILDAAMLNRRRERLRAVSKSKGDAKKADSQEREAKLLTCKTNEEEEEEEENQRSCCPALSLKTKSEDVIAVENLLALPPGDDTRDISLAAHIDALQHAPHPAVVSGGAIIALGACLMHYLGMHAMQMPNGMVREIDAGVVVASCIIALFAGTAALYFGFVLPSTREYTLPTAMIAGVAVSGMHYVGMYGIRYVDKAHHYLNDINNNTTISLSSSPPPSMPHVQQGSSSSLNAFVLYIVFASGAVSFASLSFSTLFYRKGLRRAADEADERVGLIVAGKLRELAALTSSSEDQSRTDPLMLRMKLANARLGAQMLKLRSFLPPSLLAQFEMRTNSSSSDEDDEDEDEDNHRDDDDDEEEKHYSDDDDEADLVHSELGRRGAEGEKGDTTTSEAFDEGELSGFHNTSTSASVSTGYRPPPRSAAAAGGGNLGTSPRVSFFLMPPGHIGDSGNEEQPVALSPTNAIKQKYVGGDAADPSSAATQRQGLATSTSVHSPQRTNAMLAAASVFGNSSLLLKKKKKNNSKSIESASAAASSVAGNMREARRQQRQFGGGLAHKNVAILSLNCHNFTEIFMGDISSSTSAGIAPHIKSKIADASARPFLQHSHDVNRENNNNNTSAIAPSSKSFEALYADFTKVLSAVAKAHRGVLDIIHGDRVLMSFNASMPNASYGKSASTAAIQLARDVSAIGGGPCVSVGIASGRARVGNMGSTDNIMKFNICGPVVGHAVRAQELAYALHEEHGVHIAGLVTDEMRLAVRSRAVDIVLWRHMRSPMIVSEIVGSLSSFASPCAITGSGRSDGQGDGCNEWMYELETKVNNDPFATVNRAFSRTHGLIVRRLAAVAATACDSPLVATSTANTTSAALTQVDFAGKSLISESSVNSLLVSKGNNNTSAQLVTIQNNNNNNSNGVHKINSVFLDAITSLRSAKLGIAGTDNNKTTARSASGGSPSPASMAIATDIVATCLCSNCRSQRPQRTLDEILDFSEAAFWRVEKRFGGLL